MNSGEGQPYPAGIVTEVATLTPPDSWAPGTWKAGTNVDRIREGWLRDFCPICRDLRAFAVVRVVGRSHLMQIVVRTDDSHRELVCADCGVRLRAGDDLPGEYFEFAEDAAADRDPLGSRAAARLEIERHAADRRHKLRTAFLREPFLVLEAIRRARPRRWDEHSFLSLLLTLLGCLALGWIGGAQGRGPHAIWNGLSLLFFMGGSLWTARVYYRGPDRSARTELLPLLKRALAPLASESAELEGVVRTLREEGVGLADLFRSV